MNKVTLKKILGFLIILFVVTLTLKYIKVLPAVMKLIALGANAATIYFAINYFIKQKKEKENDTETTD